MAPIHYRGSGAAVGRCVPSPAKLDTPSKRAGWFSKHCAHQMITLHGACWNPGMLRAVNNITHCYVFFRVFDLQWLFTYWWMITWTRVIFQEVDPNQALKIKTELSTVGACLWWRTCVEFIIFRDIWLNLCLLVLTVGIWNVDLAHVGQVWISHYSWRAAFYVLVAASWLSLGSFLSLSLSPCPCKKEAISFSSLRWMLSTVGLVSPCPLRASPTPCTGRGRSGTPYIPLTWFASPQMQ